MSLKSAGQSEVVCGVPFSVWLLHAQLRVQGSAWAKSKGSCTCYRVMYIDVEETTCEHRRKKNNNFIPDWVLGGSTNGLRSYYALRYLDGDLLFTLSPRLLFGTFVLITARQLVLFVESCESSYRLSGLGQEV